MRKLLLGLVLAGATALPQVGVAAPFKLVPPVNPAEVGVSKIGYLSNYTTRPYAYTRYYAYGNPRRSRGRH